MSVTGLRQLDAQLQGWLRRSYLLMGMQGRLQAPKRGKRRRQGAGQ
jgi:hypothetical protein